MHMGLKRIALEQGMDMRTLARLLQEGTLSGPLLLVDRDEPMAVMIRYRAWAPRLDRFVFIDGRYRCDECRRSGSGHALPPPGIDLGAMLEAANAHWREKHMPPRPGASRHTNAIPVTKVDRLRTARGIVNGVEDAQERLTGLYGTRGIQQLRDGYTLIGWWAAREGTNSHYFVLKDGRTDGPFVGLHALRDAALRMAATPLDGET